MSTHLSRRTFVRHTSSGLCGLLAGSMPGAETGGRQEHNAAAKRLILLGLNGLARAHTMSYFTDGHRSAALISAHLMCEENHLAEEARARIEQLLDLNWAQTPLCAPFPEEDPDPEQVRKIGEALMEARGSLREVGHNAIFAMHALRGFRLMPELATPRRIQGVCSLLRAIKPWRDDTRPAEDVDPPPFGDLTAASAFVLREAGTAIDRWQGHGQGFSGHMLTFGQALVELAEMGASDWAESCREAFRKYVTITRGGPGPEDKPRPDHRPSQLRPNSAEYWRKRGDRQVDIGHAFKYPYSYYNLLARVSDDTLRRELDAKAWQVF
ncbi:MAG: hypothetical protein ACO1TE_28605 [Prosthecobacter sp.]